MCIQYLNFTWVHVYISTCFICTCVVPLPWCTLFYSQQFEDLSLFNLCHIFLITCVQVFFYLVLVTLLLTTPLVPPPEGIAPPNYHQSQTTTTTYQKSSCKFQNLILLIKAWLWLPALLSWHKNGVMATTWFAFDPTDDDELHWPTRHAYNFVHDLSTTIYIFHYCQMHFFFYTPHHTITSHQHQD